MRKENTRTHYKNQRKIQKVKLIRLKLTWKLASSKVQQIRRRQIPPRVSNVLFSQTREIPRHFQFFSSSLTPFCCCLFERKIQPNGIYDLEMETEDASLTMLLTDIAGDKGPSPLDAMTGLVFPLTLLMAALIRGFLV